MASVKGKAAMTKENGDITITLDNQESPTDVIHGIAQSKLNKPIHEWDGDDSEHVGQIILHPNTSSDTISKIYDHAFPKTDGDGQPQSQPLDESVVSAIFENKKASLAHAEDYINRVPFGDRNNRTFDHAAQHPGLSDDFKKIKTDEYINNQTITNTKNPINFNYNAGYLHSLLLDRPLPEPEVGNMTQTQKDINLKVKKLDRVIFDGLLGAKHTPEEHDHSVKIFSSDAPYGYKPNAYYDTFDQTVRSFISHQKDLSPQHLEALASAHSSSGQTIEKIIEHPNVDPAFISKIALTDNRYIDGHSPREDALASSRLPETVRQSIIDSYDPVNPDMVNGRVSVLKALLGNESLPAQDVYKIYEKAKGSSTASAALNHPNSDPSMIEDYYQSSKPKLLHTGVAWSRNILSFNKTPPSVLKDMVASNKSAEISIEAMKHPNADMSVVEAGLKRKMKAVQDAATKHPLVAHKVLRDKLKNGTIRASTIIYDKETSKAFGDITTDDVNLINEKYKQRDPKASLDDTDFNSVKYWLSTSESVSEDVQKQNRADLVADYLKSPPEDTAGLPDVIANLALDHNDQSAKDALLKNPGEVLSTLDYKNPNLDTSFLSSAEPLLEANYNKKTAYVLVKKSYLAFLKPLLQNPNLSQELFDKISQSPAFLENNDLLNPSYRHWNSTAEQKRNKTLLDVRYADSDETAKAEGFQKIANLGTTDATRAVLDSNTAPSDIWNKAFSDYEPGKRARFVKQDTQSAISKMDEVTLTKALFGVTDPLGYSAHLQKSVLNGLVSTNPSHVKTLNTYINRVFGQESENQLVTKLSHNTIVDSIQSDFWRNPESDSVVKNALSKNNALGVRMALEKESKSAPGTPYPLGDKYVEGLKNQFNFDNNPKEYHKRWLNVFSNHKNNDHFRDANLDFLSDLPEDAENDFELRKAVLKTGKFSNEKVYEIMRADPKAFGAALQGMPPPIHAKNVQAALDAQVMHPDVMHGILGTLSYKSIISPDRTTTYSREKMTDQEWDVTVGYAEQLIDHAMTLNKDGHLHSNSVAAIADNLTKTPRRSSRDGLTIPQRKQLVHALVEKVQSTNIVDIARKSDILSSMAELINDNEITPNNLKNAAAKIAIEAGDIDTLLSIKDSGKATREVTTAISSILKKTANLNNEQLFSFSKLLRRDDTSEKNALMIISALSEKFNNGNQADFGVIHDSLDNVKNAIHYDNEVSNKATDHLLKVALSNRGEMSNSATKILVEGVGGFLPKIQKKIITGLPSDIDGGISPHGRVSASVINDPEILLQATHGWKLKLLASSVLRTSHSLDANTIEVLSNRIIDSNEITNTDKIKLSAEISTGNSPEHQQAAINLFRAQGGAGALHFVESFNNNSSSRATVSVGVAVTHAMDYIKEKYKSNGSDNLTSDSVNTLDALSSLRSITKLAHNTSHGTESPGQQQVTDSFVKAIDLLHDIHGSLISKIENRNGSISFADIYAIKANYNHLVSSSLKANKMLPHASAMNLLKATSFESDMLQAYINKNGKNLDDAQLFTIKKAYTDSNSDLSDSLSEWMENTPISPEKIVEAISFQPKLKMKLDSLSSIPLDVIKSVDVSEMLNNGNPDNVHLFASSLSGIPIKMKKDEAPQILDHMIPQVLNSFESMHNNVQGSILNFLNRSVENFPDHFNKNKLKDIASKINNKKLAAELYVSAAKAGAGGLEIIKLAIDMTEEKTSVMDIARTAKLDKEMIDHLFSNSVMEKGKKDNAFDEGRLAIGLSGNKKIDSDSVSMIYAYANKTNTNGSDTIKIYNNLVEHPNLNFDIYKNLYNYFNATASPFFLPGVKFNKAFLNSKFGGELLRSLPAKIPPNIKGVEDIESKLPKTFEYSLQKERIKGVLPNIPAEGIHWANFKKQNQQASNWNEIKSIFLSKEDDIARPEDFVKALDEYGGDFHLTFSRWDGAQRHSKQKGNLNANLVVQLNTGEKMEAELKEDPKLFSFFQLIQKAANRVGQHGDHQIGGHPVTPFCASWIRVDTTAGQDGWVIEEFQSDFASSLREQVEAIRSQHPEGLTLEGEHFHPDDMKTYAKRIEKIISGWHEASSKGMEEFAKKQGVKTLYLHGEDVRAKLSGMDKREAGNPIWMQHMYNHYPKANGWEDTTYSEYPNASADFKRELEDDGRSLKCWKKEIK